MQGNPGDQALSWACEEQVLLNKPDLLLCLVDERKAVDVVSLDFIKAFDIVSSQVSVILYQL